MVFAALFFGLLAFLRYDRFDLIFAFLLNRYDFRGTSCGIAVVSVLLPNRFGLCGAIFGLALVSAFF